MRNEPSKIDKLQNSKAFNIVLAVLFAVFMCLLAHSESNPTTTKVIEVPVTYTGTAIDDSVYMAYVSNKPTVTVTIKGSQNTINNTTAKDFECVIDLSNNSANYDSTSGKYVAPAPKTRKLGVTIVDSTTASFAVNR